MPSPLRVVPRPVHPVLKHAGGITVSVLLLGGILLYGRPEPWHFEPALLNVLMQALLVLFPALCAWLFIRSSSFDMEGDSPVVGEAGFRLHWLEDWWCVLPLLSPLMIGLFGVVWQAAWLLADPSAYSCSSRSATITLAVSAAVTVITLSVSIDESRTRLHGEGLYIGTTSFVPWANLRCVWISPSGLCSLWMKGRVEAPLHQFQVLPEQERPLRDAFARQGVPMEARFGGGLLWYKALSFSAFLLLSLAGGILVALGGQDPRIVLFGAFIAAALFAWAGDSFRGSAMILKIPVIRPGDRRTPPPLPPSSPPPPPPART